MKLALFYSLFILMSLGLKAQNPNNWGLSPAIKKAFDSKNYPLSKKLMLDELGGGDITQKNNYIRFYLYNSILHPDKLLAAEWEKTLALDSFLTLFNQTDAVLNLLENYMNVVQSNNLITISSAETTDKIFDHAERIFTLHQDWSNLVATISYRGTLCFYISHQGDKATTYYLKSINLYKEKKINNPPLATSCYTSLIYNLYGLEKNFELASFYIDEFVEIKGITAEVKASMLEMKFDILKQKGDFERSFELIREQYETYQKDSSLALAKAIAEIRMGEYQNKKGNYKEADKWYNSARKYLSKFANRAGMLNYYWLNYLYGQQTNNFLRWGNRLDTAQQTLQLADPNNIRPEFYHPCEVEIAIRRQNSKNIENILISGVEKFLQNDKNNRIGASDVPALLAFSKAADYLQRENDAFQFVAEAEEMLNISYQEYKKSANIADPINALNVLKQKILLLRRYQPQQSYQKEVNLAIALLDNLQQSYSTKGAKELLLNDAMFFYESAIEICYQKAHKTGKMDDLSIAEIYYLSEKSKSMLLLESLQENKARSFANIPQQLRSEEMSLLNDVNYYEAQVAHESDSKQKELQQDILSQKRKKLDSLKTILKTQHSKYFEYKYAQKLPKIESIQAQLDDKSLMLHYFAGKNNIYALAISKQKVAIHKIAIDEQYYNRLSHFLERLSGEYYIHNYLTQNFSLFVADAYWLYTDLVQPFEAKIQDSNCEKLLIVPDGKLHYLPFELLLTSNKIEAGKKTYQDLPYLLKKLGISYAYSATIWSENMLSPASKYSNLLAMAPTYQTKTIPPKSDQEKIFALLSELDGTKKEVEWLEKFFKGQFFFNETATETQLKANISTANIIHLSMHGVLDENPAYSGLYFCPNRDSSEDNVLYAYEIPSLDLSADLVVLSACETGLGRYQHGEGVISMGRSFMYAGAPAIITSLWSVNDKTAVFFTQHFYSNLSQGKDKTEALRQAKLTYLKQAKGLAAHPFYWAAFVLQGNTNPINIAQKTVWQWWLVGIGLTLISLFYTSRKLRR